MIYIGQTVRKLDTRIYWHIHSARTGPTSFLHRAINKYGPHSFEWSIIDTADSKEILNEKEEYWISYFNCKTPSGYNMTDGGTGGSNNKGIPHKDETIKKIAEGKMGTRNPFFGKTHSLEVKKRMSERLKGNKHLLGHKHSEETKNKMSVSHKDRNKKLHQKPDMDNNPI